MSELGAKADESPRRQFGRQAVGSTHWSLRKITAVMRVSKNLTVRTYSGEVQNL